MAAKPMPSLGMDRKGCIILLYTVLDVAERCVPLQEELWEIASALTDIGHGLGMTENHMMVATSMVDRAVGLAPTAEPVDLMRN